MHGERLSPSQWVLLLLLLLLDGLCRVSKCRHSSEAAEAFSRLEWLIGGYAAGRRGADSGERLLAEWM